MAKQTRESLVCEARLEHMARVAAVGVRHRDPRAMRVLLGIERLRVKTRGGGEKAEEEMGGVPITIFGAAIREMERLRGVGGDRGDDEGGEEKERDSSRGGHARE